METHTKTINLQKLKPKENMEEYCESPMDFYEYIYGKILTSYSNLSETPQAKLCSGESKNAFFDSFWIPFNLHSELILSPDDIWIAILLSFSRHVNIN